MLLIQIKSSILPYEKGKKGLRLTFQVTSREAEWLVTGINKSDLNHWICWNVSYLLNMYSTRPTRC